MLQELTSMSNIPEQLSSLPPSSSQFELSPAERHAAKVAKARFELAAIRAQAGRNEADLIQIDEARMRNEIEKGARGELFISAKKHFLSSFPKLFLQLLQEYDVKFIKDFSPQEEPLPCDRQNAKLMGIAHGKLCAFVKQARELEVITYLDELSGNQFTDWIQKLFAGQTCNNRLALDGTGIIKKIEGNMKSQQLFKGQHETNH